MKTTSLFLTAGLLATSLATPLTPRADDKKIVAQEFDVSSFTAGCVPHGTQCSISFDVATNQMPFQTHCTFTGAPLGSSSLPDVGFAAGTCADKTINWSFRAVANGDAKPFAYEFALVDSEQSLAASKFFIAQAFPLVNAGSSYYQTFTGEGRFVVHGQE
ncbi:hypothetical protein B0T18DRAFT_320708 [Schizothecium vesticola]|uniref:AA1-like domain-containing protein n=1 Tax=Schizothecium vesticola TaxID=314040 RepID=A0AA40F3H5_9PEZI|nr:hypothetical protein B0T18DRAFT_320708 [Schizothecium vesticola]